MKMLLADQNRCRPSSRWWPLRRPIFEPASKRKRMAEKLLCFFECTFVDVSEEFSIRSLKTTKYFFILCLTASKESFAMSGSECTHDLSYRYAILGGSVEDVQNSRGHDAMEIRVVHLFLVVSLDTVGDEACKWLVCFYRTPSGSPDALICKRTKKTVKS